MKLVADGSTEDGVNTYDIGDANFVMATVHFLLGNREQTKKHLEAGVKLRHGECQQLFGTFYQRGWIVTKNSRKAYVLIRDSARQGTPVGLFALSEFYENGWGDVSKNLPVAFVLRKLAVVRDGTSRFAFQLVDLVRRMNEAEHEQVEKMLTKIHQTSDCYAEKRIAAFVSRL
ncbi:MAG: hypothetical protein PHO20_00825 [Candidatus Peribacteraceae bacterium]|nr:hypothetical protein [Candidatus Peribacteraceae bacterium]MDD5739293.1 hypothetical protein [Candidatus Peribacteraceae bacterium]